MAPHLAFTRKFSTPTRVIFTDIQISEAITREESRNKQINLKKYIAIWDTGATNSAITRRVVDDLKLKPTGIAEVRHADGKSPTNTYLVNITLPNHAVFGLLRVTEAKLLPDDGAPEEKQPQVLVGMDIIGSGDFAVTNSDGKTTVSFCLPSLGEIDFITEADRRNLGETRQQRRARKRELEKRGLI